MATLRFLLKRLAAQRLMALAVIVTLAFSIGVLVAGPLYAAAAREAILSSTLTTSSVTSRNARLAVYAGDGFDRDSAQAAVERASEQLPIDVVVPQAQAVVRLEETGVSVPLLYREGAFDHMELKGAPPGPSEVVIRDSTAQGLGARLGDPVAVIGPTGERLVLTLSATYRTPDLADPFWYGNRNPFPAPDTSDQPPLLVDRATMADAVQTLGLTTEYVWDVYLALDEVPYEQARLTPGRLIALEDALREEPGMSTVRLATGLDTQFDLVDQRVENLRIPILLVVFQIAFVTLAVLAGVGALTLTRQTFELAVLHSRGFTRRTLLMAQGLQAVTSAVLAYPLGLLIGMLLARLAGRSNGRLPAGVRFPVTMSAEAEVLGIVIAVVGAIILLLLSVPVVGRTILEERRVTSREERPLLARVPVELIVIPLGIFALIQLRGGAKPKPGAESIEPLVLAAPTLLLFGASFLALRLLLFILRRLDTRIGRTRSLSRYLAGRRLERSPGTGFAAALLLVLSMGLVVVATSYRAIVLTNHRDAAHTQIGADRRVVVSPPDQVLSALDELPPRTTGVVRTDPSLEGSFPLPPVAFGIDPDTFLDGGWWRSDFADRPIEDILEELRAPAAGVAFPEGARTLSIGLDATRPASVLALVVTTIALDGTVAVSERLPLTRGESDYEVELPAGGGRLLTLGLWADTAQRLASDLSVTFTSIAVDGVDVPLEGWRPITWRGSSGDLVVEVTGATYDFSPGAGNVVGGIQPQTPPLPAIVDESVAEQMGDAFTVTMAGQHIDVRVIATANQFPSAVPNTPFIAVSGPALLERQFAIPEAGLTLTEVWANGEDDPIAALEADGFFIGDVEATAPVEATLAQLPQSLAVGMNVTAAVGGLALVIIGVAAGMYFAQRRRDYEFAALRAMGARGPQIRRTLALEQIGLLGFAVVAGLGIGYALLRVMMPYIGTSLGVSYPPPLLVIDWPLLGAAVLAVAAATTVSLAASARVMMRSSITGVLRGEAE